MTPNCLSNSVLVWLFVFIGCLLRVPFSAFSGDATYIGLEWGSGLFMLFQPTLCFRMLMTLRKVRNKEGSTQAQVVARNPEKVKHVKEWKAKYKVDRVKKIRPVHPKLR